MKLIPLKFIGLGAFITLKLSMLSVFAQTETNDSLNAKYQWEQKEVPIFTDSLIEERAVTDSLLETQAPDTSKQVEADSSAIEEPKEKVTTGEKAPLKGLIINKANGKPIEGVSITIEIPSGQKWELTSDESGLFSTIPIEAGTYTLKFKKKKFQPKTEKNFEFTADGDILNILLSKPVARLKAIKVEQKTKRGSASSVLASRRKSKNIMDGISSEQISKSTDSDAGAIAKRITGTSLVGGKYVFVRGLGERYTNMTLNGLPVPSPEKDKRVVPQDLFPASALESFTIYKTFSPDLMPDFAGGSMNLTTKGFPEKNFYKVSVGMSSLDYIGDDQFLIMGDDRLDYDGGDGIVTYLGYDDGTRAIPKGVPKSVPRSEYDKEYRALFAKQFNNKLAIDTASILPGQSYGLSVGRLLVDKKNMKGGFLADVSFKNKFKNDDYTKISYKEEGFDFQDSVHYVANAQERNIRKGEVSQTLSILFNMGFETKNHRIWSKNLYASLTDDETNHTTAIQTRGGPGAGMDSDLEERFVLEFNRRELWTNQIGGGHYIGWGALDSSAWALGFAKTLSETPDKKRYYFTREIDYYRAKNDTTVNGIFYPAKKEYPIIGEGVTYDMKSPWGTRAWEEVNEFNLSGRGDLYLVIPPEWSKKDVFLKKGKIFSHIKLPEAKIGWMSYYKNRKFDMTRYDWDGLQQYFNENNPDMLTSKEGDFGIVEDILHPDTVSNILDPDNGDEGKDAGFQTTPQQYDAYTAQDFSFQTYGSANWDLKFLGKNIGFLGGLRAEKYWLKFKAPFTDEVIFQNPELKEDSAIFIRENSWYFYPSAGTFIEPTKNTKLQFQYARTKVRPELRERAPTQFYDTEDERFVEGNPNLVDTDVDHYDLRWDWFLKGGQIVSASIFNKEFENPVESYINPNSSPNIKQFQNANPAWVRGLEGEIFLKTSPWIKSSGGWWEFLKGFGLYLNAAWIKSEVEVDTTGEYAAGFVGIVSVERPLKGQSGYLWNAKLSHDQTVGRFELTNALLFNEYGDRISDGGSFYVDDIYESSFPSLDLLSRVKFSAFSLSLKIKNLLNSKKSLYVDALDKTSKEVERKYLSREDEGISYSLGLSVNW